MKIKPMTLEIMVERARQNYNKRHCYQIPASNTKLAEKVRREIMWENVIKKRYRKNEMDKISLVFFGTPDIGVKSLEHLYNKFNVLAVVTQPDKPSGRGHKLTPSPVKVFATEHNIPVFQPKSIRKEPEIIEALKNFSRIFCNICLWSNIITRSS